MSNGSDVLMLPKESDLSKALQAGHDHVLQQLMLQVFEYVANSIEQDNNKDYVVESAKLIVDTLNKERQQMMDVDEPRMNNLTTTIASDSFVDALWLQTSYMDQPASCKPLLELIKYVLTELYGSIDNIEENSHRKYLYTRLLESCDAAFLESIEVISSSNDLQKKLRLTNTAVNYRQHKFNLLAEESEGYSKLLYFLLLSRPSNNAEAVIHSSNGKAITESNKRKKDIIISVGTIISIYSLDPNRCLDLGIDIVESELLFIQQKSSLTAESRLQLPDCNQRLQFLLDYIRSCSVTEKLPQLLGFKLKGRLEQQQQKQKEQASLQPQPTSNTSPSSSSERNVHSLLFCITWIYYQSCIVEKEPLFDLINLIHYLPDNENNASWSALIEQTYQQISKNERERIVNVGRVRLSSGSDNISEKNTNSSENLNATQNVLKPLKEQLTIQLMHMILFLFPTSGWDMLSTVQSFKHYWSELSCLFPSTVGCAICDWVHEKISGWLTEFDGKDSNNVVDDMEIDGESNVKEDTISLDLVMDTIVDPLLHTWESGCIVLRPVLYSEICRLVARLVKEQKSVTNSVDGTVNSKMITLLRSFLLPSLSLFLSNPAISLEIWNVLKLLPYRTRYSLYSSWKRGGLERDGLKSSDKPLWLIEGELQMGKDARYSLKRLSKDTIREMSRNIAKCCHSHPLVVFTTILNQIESYDNLVQVMVDSFRFLTPLSLDVLGFSILQRLIGTTGGSNRSRLKENGVNVSQWLQSLESFTGAFYKRFPYVEFQGILCYLIQQIKNGQVMELGMLRTLLKTAGGWGFADYSPAASLSASQLEGRAGSTTLARETMFFGIVEDISLQASHEVRRVLQNDNMGVTVLILLAQVKNKIVFGKPSNGERPQPVKLIGNLFDTCQVVMTILLDFLTKSFETKGDYDIHVGLLQYSKSLPTLTELLSIYRMDVASAWMLCRPLIRATASTFSQNSPSMDLESKFCLDDDSRKLYKSILFTEETWDYLSIQLFEQFYTATLYDLFCPEDIYQSEIVRLEKDIERLSRHKTITHQQMSVQPGPVSEKNDKDEIERMKKVAEQLALDFTSHKQHVRSFHQSLEHECKTFFCTSKTEPSRSAMTFFHRCVYPRSLQGPDEAMFCARFVQALHEKDAPGFSTLHFFDALIVILSRSLFCLTEGEAACASILLSETWKVVSRWRYDDQAFEQELVGKPGSFMVVEPLDDVSISQDSSITSESYKNLYNKWHAAVGSTCIGCLQSSEYIHLRNCLVVLTRMVDCYPTRPRLANKLLECLEPLQDESNSLADIRASAQSYSMQLKKARDDGVWKEEDAATVQARIEREQAAAAKRYRKAEEQMAEIKRDQEKITEEIGDIRDRDRGGRNRGVLSSTIGGGLGGGIKSFESSVRGNRGSAGDMNETRREQDDRRRLSDDRHRGAAQQSLSSGPNTDRWSRDNRGGSSSGTGSYVAIGSTVAPSGAVSRRVEDNTNQLPGRGLEGRWQRANDTRDQHKQTTTATTSINREGSKRSRPSSPTEQGETREDGTHPPTAKRVRQSQDPSEDIIRQEEASNRNRSSASRAVQRGRRHVVRR